MGDKIKPRPEIPTALPSDPEALKAILEELGGKLPEKPDPRTEENKKKPSK